MSGKIHILFLSELFHPHGSGGALGTYLYAKLLSKSDFDVIVITSRFDREPLISKNEEFTIYRLPSLKVKSAKYSTLLRFDVLLSDFMRKMIKWADVVYVARARRLQTISRQNDSSERSKQRNSSRSGTSK
jgi:hypothetical protein